MRFGMGLIKNEHGVFQVRRKVPKALEVATARVMGVPQGARLVAQGDAANQGREAGEGPRETCHDEVRPRPRASRGASCRTSGSGNLRFTENVAFTSPSAAAAAVMGTSRNGRTDWINSDTNETYAAWQDGSVANANSAPSEIPD